METTIDKIETHLELETLARQRLGQKAVEGADRSELILLAEQSGVLQDLHPSVVRMFLEESIKAALLEQTRELQSA